MTGNGMDFNGGARPNSRVYGGDFQNTTPTNIARGDYQFTGRRQNLQDTVGHQRQQDKYVFDTVVVGGRKPRRDQGRSSTLSSAGGETEVRRGGINEAGDSLQGHAIEIAAISDGMLPVNMVGQGYTLDGVEMNVDDEMGEGTGREGSEDALSGGTEGTHGILKINMDEGQTSTWSETKTKAGKERKRLPLACIACRRKKIRCSGEKPTCRHCLRSRTPCVYKQSTRKAAPRTDYMAMLDRRLKRMEERLIKNVPKEEISSVLAVTGRSVVKPSMSTNSTRLGSSGKKRTAGTAFGSELDAWAHSETPNKHRSGNVSIGAWELSTMKGADMDDGSQALPSKDIQEHLAEVFFEFIYGQPYFLLHKSSFMRRLRSGTAPPVLVLALCALSARFSNHPAVRHDPPFLAGEGFATEARRLLLKNFDNPNITNVTVCTMLCLHEFGTCQGGRSWAFGGMATRMAHALQLHKEINNDPIGKSPGLSGVDCPPDEGALGNSMSFVDREIRRRCMWACFMMDRFTSSGTERPSLISETELEIQLPSHDRNLELDIPTITERLDGTIHEPRAPSEGSVTDNMGIGAYIVRAITLYGRVARYFNQGGTEREKRQIWDPDSEFCALCAEAELFEKNLPERLRYTTENAQSHATEHLFGQFIYVHVALQQIKLFLRKSAIPASPSEVPNMPKEFARSAGEVTLKSATRIAKILEDVEERGIVVAAPFMGYCAFSAALIHLVRMFSTSNNVQVEAKRYMEVCLRFLSQIRQYWGLFCYITDNLKRLYRKFSEASAKGSPFLGHQETRRVLQYGDWFQKYPQGVSASHYEKHTKRGQSQDGDNSSSEDAVLSQRSNLQTAEEFFAKLGSRSQRSTPSVPPPSKRQTQSHTRASPVHTSAVGQSSSPRSVHHSQSPAVYQSPAIQQSPVMGISPAMVSTPPMTAGHGNIDLKLDPQLLNPPMLSRSSDASPVNFEQPTQHHSSMSSLLSSMPSPVSFPNYPIMPRTSAAAVSPVLTGMHHSQNHQQDYFYDLYPAGSDPSAMVTATNPLSGSIWTGFDPHISLTDGSPFTDQGGSAWFLPFNSCPPDFETRVGGMGNLNIMSGGGGGGGGEDGVGGGGGGDEAGDRGDRGGVPHMISPTSSGHTGPGAPSSATAYHDGVR